MITIEIRYRGDLLKAVQIPEGTRMDELQFYAYYESKALRPKGKYKEDGDLRIKDVTPNFKKE